MPVFDLGFLVCDPNVPEAVAYCAAFNASFSVTVSAGLALVPVAMVFALFSGKIS